MNSPSASLLSLKTAKPYQFRFDPTRTALIIIDVQRDFVDPNGFGSIQCGDDEVFASVRNVVPVIRKVLDTARALGLHVVHTREGHKPDLSDLSSSKKERQMNAPNGHHGTGIGDQGPMGRLLVRGEFGHDIVDELKPLPGEVVIDKPGKGSFWATNLHRTLMAHGVSHLILCGVTTECCVTTTAREANDRGFECCILRDGTGGFNPAFVENSLDMISSYDGLFGFTAESEEFVALGPALIADVTTPPITPPDISNVNLDLASLQQLYKGRVFHPSDVMQSVLGRIKDYEQTNPNVWIHLRSEEEIMADAEALKQRYSEMPTKELPLLYGVPFAVKDNIDVAHLPTTAACQEYKYVPTESAPVISLLIAAGAILIGKTNMDQLATGLSGCRSPFGTLRSVHGSGRISGGSSSGSGVAVAAKLVSFSLGTDTAGSGRVPAALNGIVGFKPTKGTISARGVVPACRSLDTVSIFAQTAQDAREVWHILDQPDDNDAFSKDPNTLPLLLSDYRGVSGNFTFCTPPESALKSVLPEYRRCFDVAITAMESISAKKGTCLSDETYEPFNMATELLYKGTLVQERIASIGYEFLSQNMEKLHPTIKTLFQDVFNRNEPAWKVFKDQALQTGATRKAERLFGMGHLRDVSDAFDVLVVPTVGCHPTIEEMEAEPLVLNAQLGTFTHFANVLDLCAISVPFGWTDGGLPFGLSLIGGRGMDGRLLDIARMIEAKMDKK
ncbi:unnamed protein product [Clonostachys chloroleuca]|uniref:Uncharacterized protein n=1 Tax=Clonostachys chloroleuca TaxID=1926264 RepID=A0AA35Q7C4_9HYPO|nr:unnamed protein product [Clonostachys chloroleuca]